MTRSITWLGATDPCANYPTTFDSSTLKEYGAKCGKQKLKEWITKETGVDVGKCLENSLNFDQTPECIANNYGIKLGVIKDGVVQWDIVVHDAGAVGGIAVCAATGAGAAALSWCGKIGGVLGDIAYQVGGPFITAFVNLVWGDDEKIVNCNLNAPVDLVEGVVPGYPAAGTVKALAQWLGSPYQVTLPGALGPLYFPGGVAGVKAYWSRVLVMRGLAEASAIVLRDFREQTRLSIQPAMKLLDLKAPPGWFELVRPEYDGNEYDDAKLNVGGLLDAFMAPDVIRKKRGVDVIVSSYLLPSFWNGVPSSQGVTHFFELQNVNQGCVTTIMWGTRDPKIAKPAGPADDRLKKQVYWEYTTPVFVHSLAVGTNQAFLQAMNAWKASLQQDFSAKIAAGKKLATQSVLLGIPKKSGSALPVVLALGGAAALAWWLLPASVLKNNPTKNYFPHDGYCGCKRASKYCDKCRAKDDAQYDWGLFVWEKENMYRPASAIKIYRSRKVAEKAASKGDLVVRRVWRAEEP